VKELSLEQKKLYLREQIISDALVDGIDSEDKIYYGRGRAHAWVLDFRKVFSDKKFLNYTADLFWDKFDKNKSWQIGGLESASLPLITATVLSGQKASGFFIRKSRKKKGQSRLIEGKISSDPIILVDDLINSGSSFVKQIKALEAENLKVTAVFAIVKFRKNEDYKYLNERDIPIFNIFELSEFDTPKFNIPKEKTSFKLEWYFGPKKYHKLVQGSRCLPTIDHDSIYTGTDDGILRKIDRQTGKVLQQKNAETFSKDVNTSTFTNIIVGLNHFMVGTASGTLIFGDKNNFQILKRYSVADALTSQLFFDGTNIFFGIKNTSRLFPHNLASFDTETQAMSWQTPTKGAVQAMVFDGQNRNIFFGTNLGYLYCLNKDGELVWSLKTEDIFLTAPLFIDKENNKILFVGDNGFAYLLDSQDGHLITKFHLEHLIQSDSIIINDKLYASSLERELFCLDLQTKERVWTFALDGRSYSAPQYKNGYIYLGDNSGTLHKIDASTGYRDGHFVVPERIVNKVQFIDDDKIIISTSANEIYCLTESQDTL
jgi:outer membrane protein assembly factor BamB/adenine/guanine phosphoribosyltransferase-like PRPP-binding protein